MKSKTLLPRDVTRRRVVGRTVFEICRALKSRFSLVRETLARYRKPCTANLICDVTRYRKRSKRPSKRDDEFDGQTRSVARDNGRPTDQVVFREAIGVDIFSITGSNSTKPDGTVIG